MDLARPPLEAGMVEVRDGAGDGAFACKTEKLQLSLDRNLQMRQIWPLSLIMQASEFLSVLTVPTLQQPLQAGKSFWVVNDTPFDLCQISSQSPCSVLQSESVEQIDRGNNGSKGVLEAHLCAAHAYVCGVAMSQQGLVACQASHQFQLAAAATGPAHGL